MLASCATVRPVVQQLGCPVAQPDKEWASVQNTYI